MTADRLRLAAVPLALAGIGVAGYLTVVHYAGGAPVCGISHGCGTVQNSPWATLGGVPVALLGLLTYAAILVAVLLPGEAARLAAATLALGGAGFSLYLTYRELFDLNAVCEWCVASALLMCTLAVLCVTAAVRAPVAARA